MIYTNYECHYSPFALITDVINQSNTESQKLQHEAPQ